MTKRLQRVWNRFFPKIQISATGCWLWTGTTNGKGYGRISNNGRMVACHRLSLGLFRGRLISNNRLVCHRCDTPGCIYPLHLFTGSQKDNMRDMFRKGRKPHFGSLNPNNRLTESQVLEIRRRYGTESGHALAREFGISRNLPGMIFRRQAWKHL